MELFHYSGHASKRPTGSTERVESDAIADLNQVLRLKPDDAEAQSVLAKARQAVAKLEKPVDAAPVAAARVKTIQVDAKPEAAPATKPEPAPKPEL
jgi:cytochrome c-type biogenesis protein CcmH/NrfG